MKLIKFIPLFLLVFLSCGESSTEYLKLDKQTDEYLGGNYRTEFGDGGWDIVNRKQYYHGDLLNGEIKDYNDLLFFKEGRLVKRISKHSNSEQIQEIVYYRTDGTNPSHFGNRKGLNENIDSLYQKFYDNGVMEEKYSSKKGKLEGEQVFYYPNGQISQEGFYVNGDLNGEFLKYFEDGKIKESQNYVNGSQEGKRLEYSNSPFHYLSGEQNYLNDEQHGDQRSYSLEYRSTIDNDWEYETNPIVYISSVLRYEMGVEIDTLDSMFWRKSEWEDYLSKHKKELNDNYFGEIGGINLNPYRQK